MDLFSVIIVKCFVSDFINNCYVSGITRLFCDYSKIVCPYMSGECSQVRNTFYL